MKTLLLISQLILWTPLWLSAAQTNYVALYGNNANAGTSTNAPWRNIVYGINNMQANDTLQILEGVYNEGMGTDSSTGGNVSKMKIKNGTGGNYTRIMAYPGHNVKVAPDNTWNSPALFFGNYNFDPVDKSFVWFENIWWSLTNSISDSPVLTCYNVGTASSSNVFKGCKFTDSAGRHGVLQNMNGVSFYDCIATNNGWLNYLGDNDQHAWYIGSSLGYYTNCVGADQSGGGTPHAFHVNATGGSGSVNSNILINCRGFSTGALMPRGFGAYQGIGNKFINCEATNVVIGFYAAYGAIDTLWENCTAVRNGNQATGVGGGFAIDSANSTGARWVNCAAISNWANGFFIGSGVPACVASNCVSSDNLRANLENRIGSSFTTPNSLFGDQYNADFVAWNNFRLTSTSALRNAGTAPQLAILDGDGNAIAEGVRDVGRFEFTGGGTTPTVSIISLGNATEGGSAGGFQVTRTGSTSGGLTVNFTIDGSSSATETGDYGTIGTSVVIPNGQSSVTIPITAVDDAAVEGTETIILNIAAGSYTPASPTSAQVNINDNDAAPTERRQRIKQ